MQFDFVRDLALCSSSLEAEVDEGGPFIDSAHGGVIDKVECFSLDFR